MSPTRGQLRSALARTSLRDYGIVVAFVVVFVYLAMASNVFLTQRNLLNLLEQSSAIAIVAVGGTLVIIAGGFDLSAGAIFALSAIVGAHAVNEFGPVIGLVIGLLVGGALGLGNGLLTTVGRINPFIATLSSAIMIRGLALAITGGFLVPIDNEAFATLGRGETLGVKNVIWIAAGFTLVAGLVLSKSVFGHHVYASGGNAEAARLSGIPVSRVRTITFVISGVAAALAGLLIASRAASARADAGDGIEFQAIAAIVVGGTSIFGGEGAIWRTILGVLLLAMIANGFNLIGVPPAYQQIFEGGIIVAAVGLDVWARRRS